jgi:beta-lactamase superfamily II metal-dependent hydrolase
MGGYDMSTGAAAKKAAKKAKRPAGKKAPSTTKTGRTMATKKPGGASGLKVRMYRVGFGDFFLVTVPTSAGDRFILIDCGVFKGTSGTGDIGSIEEAVEDLFNTTGGKLALVIMTHRHADHIAGFSRAERFKDFTASMVWMPYWEQLNDAQGASSLQLDISQAAEQLAMQFRGRADKEAQQALAQLSNATGIDFNATAKGGTRAGGNAAALDLLKNHLGDNGKNVRYYAAGDKAELPPELKGLSAEILGPPPKEAKIFMPLTDLKKNVGQYLDSITPSDDGPIAIHPFRPQWQASPSDDYPEKDARGFAIKYQDIVNSVDNAQPDMLATAAAKIETFLNNQSLVVLFTFADKNLLFVGDAQAGNWEYWLYKLDAPIKDPTKAGDIVDQSQQILRTIDFYKVGHHGSTNATPIQAVDAMGKNHSANGFVAMCSTEFGVFGKTANESEVPRTPLMKALGDECALVRSDSFAITTTSKGVIKPAKGAAADLPKPKVGKLATKNLYVEYSF